MYLGNNYLRAFHGEWGTTQPGLSISVASSLSIPHPLTQDKGAGLPPLMCPELLLSTLQLQDPLLVGEAGCLYR